MARVRSHGYKLSYISRLIRVRFDARAKEVGLTRAQWQAIAAIRFQEGATQRELAEALDVSSVTIGRILERLEEDGWIERRPDAQDRRVYRLHLTAAAQPILEQLGGIAAEEEQRTLARLSEEERHLLSDLLDKIIGNLEQKDPSTSQETAVA